MKRTCFFLAIFLFFNLCLYPARLSEKIDWLWKKTVEVEKISQEEFELCKPYFVLMLESKIHKEDVFAIFNYFLQQKLDLAQQLSILREISLLLVRQDIGSKNLRNFISGKVKIAKTKRMDSQTLTDLLIDEIRLFSPSQKYKSTSYKLINEPTPK